MSENGGEIEVILRWIQILDSHDLDEEGEFRFKSKITTAGKTHELAFPGGDGYWVISENPARNIVDKIDLTLYRGPAGSDLVVEITGEELDKLTPNDQIETYRREFTGDRSSWIGRHQPTDEGTGDPENLTDWRLCYDILEV